MPAYTVLEMVQDILNDLDSDPVTAIDDTEESRQITQILKTTYFNIIDGRHWEHLYELFTLTETDASTPTYMTIPSRVLDIEYVKYNVRTSTDTKDKYQLITYKRPLDFMNMLDARDSSASNIDVITATSGAKGNVYNDRAPTSWTSFDDGIVVFDAYDVAVDTGGYLQTSKTQARGKYYPTWTDDDGTFVPDLPINAFSYLLNEAKSICFLNIKQAANPKIEQMANTQRRRMSNEAQKVTQDILYPNYGRRGKK